MQVPMDKRFHAVWQLAMTQGHSFIQFLPDHGVPSGSNDGDQGAPQCSHTEVETNEGWPGTKVILSLVPLIWQEHYHSHEPPTSGALSTCSMGGVIGSWLCDIKTWSIISRPASSSTTSLCALLSIEWQCCILCTGCTGYRVFMLHLYIVQWF